MSKNTSKFQAKQENSVRKLFWLVLVLLLVGLAAVGLILYRHTGQDTECIQIQNNSPCKVMLELAQSPEEQAKGLGGRTSLASGKGMLFVFLTSDRQCFWMKDMNFGLDIVWIDANQKIANIEKNISPNTYPQSYCSQGQYVLEINAGEADKLGLYSGQQLYF